MIPPIASRFVAGEDPATALEHTEDLNERGIGTILNLLGEHYDDRAPADDDATAYRRLLEEIAESGLEACISVKPSQIGLDVSTDLFREHLGRIAERADEVGGFVWIDMEDHTTTDATIAAFEELAARHPDRVGVCLQANLHRTAEDLAGLAGHPGKVRLVKGAYDPPEELAYRGRDRVDEAYAALLELAFERFDDGVAVATHDPTMIDRAIELGERHGTGYELQMLMGVRQEAQFELARDHDVWQYVPFGGKWFAYFTRRVAERRENLLFALRAILGR